MTHSTTLKRRSLPTASRWSGAAVGATGEVSDLHPERSRPRATGDQVAKTLGLPTTMVTINPAETVGVQVAVRLAADSTFTTPSPTTSVTAK